MQHLLNVVVKAEYLLKKYKLWIPEQGSLRLVVNPRDIAHADTGNYDVVLTYTDGRGLNIKFMQM